MTALSISRAWVDRVLEVEAFANGVTFDDFVTHFAYGILDGIWGGLRLDDDCGCSGLFLRAEREEEANQPIE